MKKIIPNLWFNNQAEEAVKFYTDIFRHSKIGKTTFYDKASAEASGQPENSVLTIEFTIENQEFIALNGGPIFSFTPSISFFVKCSSEDEVNYLFNQLSDEGKVLMPLDKYPFSKKYGWAEDKFGVSWQISLVENEINQKITPMLMFVRENVGKAEEAIIFYTKVFRKSKIKAISRYGINMEPELEGTISFSSFELEEQEFFAMDSALDHNFSFSPAISFMVSCEQQEEVDYFWEKLSADPQAEQCGWLSDKYGVSWQIVPIILDEFLSDPDKEKAERVMKVFLNMKKIEMSDLIKAYNGED